MLEETEHFRHWRQEEVAKIVHCGEPFPSDAFSPRANSFVGFHKGSVPHWV